jgi:hypothetical protein
MIAAVRAIGTIRIVLLKATAIDAHSGYATFTAAVRAFAVIVEVIVVMIVRVSHPLPLRLWGERGGA